MFILFYAGHGMMKDNQQVFILNGKLKSKKIAGKDTDYWDFIYPIDRKIMDNFRPYY